MKPIKKIVKPIRRDLKKISNIVTKIVEPIDFSISLEYPPNVKEILNRYGNEIIRGITLKRTPVSGLLTGALSAFSLGKFGERMEKSFDELFHLFMDIITENNNIISLEKIERVNMIVNPPIRPDETSKSVSNIPQGLTIIQLMENARKRMGNQFFRYDAVINNCQDFLLNVLQASGIGDQSDYEFIKQDTAKLFKGLPMLKKIGHTATDLGAIANKTIQGGRIENDEDDDENIGNYSMFLNHLTSHITDPQEPIDMRDFTQAIKIINIIKQLKENKIEGNGINQNIKIEVQSIVFSKKNNWSVSKARKWLRDRKFKGLSPDMTEHTIRFRQIDPSNFNEFKSHRLKGGIILVFGLK